MDRPVRLEQRRRQAVQAVQKGDKVKDVARIMGVTPRSIYRWLNLAKKSDGLAAKPHPGPKPRLSLRQQRLLEKMLCRGARGSWLGQRTVDHPTYRGTHSPLFRRFAASRSRRPLLAATLEVVAAETAPPSP